MKNNKGKKKSYKVDFKYLYIAGVIVAITFIIDVSSSKIKYTPYENVYSQAKNSEEVKSIKKLPIYKMKKDQLLVVLKDEDKVESFADKAKPGDKKIFKSTKRISKRTNKDKVKKSELDNTVVAKLDKEYSDTELLALIKDIKKDKAVKYVEPDYEVTFDSIPNDSNYSNLWGLKKIEMEKAWDKVTDSSNIIVASIDTGVNYRHEDLQDNIWVNQAEISKYRDRLVDTNSNGIIDCEDLFESSNSFVKDGIDDDDNSYVDDYCGWDFGDNDNDPMDKNYHGTHTSGTLGATGNNGKGVVGVNWKVKIMPLKTIGDNGNSSLAFIVNAIRYATNMGAKISNNSWGTSNSEILRDTITLAHDQGHLFVAAAGNNSINTTFFYPSAYADALSVSAVNENDNLASFSNYGPKLDVAAPGTNIRSTYSGDSYATMQGTSMATPHVAGAAVLLSAYKTGLEIEQIRQIIRKSAKDLGDSGKDDKYGYGRLDVNNMLTFASAHPDIPAPYISFPKTNSDFTGDTSNEIEIKGKIYGGNIKNYKLYLNNGESLKELKSSDKKPDNDVLGTFKPVDLSDIKANSIKIVVTALDDEKYEFEVYGILKNNINITMTMPLLVGKGVFDITATSILNANLSLSNYEVLWKKESDPDSSYSNSGVTLTNSINGVIAKWNTKNLNNDVNYNLVYKITASNNESETVTTTTKINEDIIPNWPKSLKWEMYDDEFFGYTPAIDDLDGDGMKEVVIAYHDKLYAFNRDGSNVNGFPFKLEKADSIYYQEIFNRPVLITDYDNNGKKEILAMSNKTNNQFTKLYVIDYQGNVMSGWPKEFPLDNSIYSDNSPITVDRDGDGKKDIVFYSVTNLQNVMQVFNFDGTSHAGFPKKISSYAGQHGTFSAADIDFDGKPEFALVDGGRNLFVYDNNGNVKSGFPVTLSANYIFTSSVVFGNINMDPRPEIFALNTPKGCFSNCQRNLIAYDYKGIPVTIPYKSSWMSYFPANMNNVTMGDLDNYPYDDAVYDEYLPSTPVVNFTNDSVLERIGINGTDFSINVFDIKMKSLWRAPALVNYNIYSDKGRYFEPVLGDMNNNGKYEMALKAGEYFYLFEIPISAGSLSYQTHQKDNLRSGNVQLNYNPGVAKPGVEFVGPGNNSIVQGVQRLTIKATNTPKPKYVILQNYSDRPALTPGIYSDKVWFLTSNNDTYYKDIDFSNGYPRGSTQLFTAYGIDQDGNVTKLAASITLFVSNITPLNVTITTPAQNSNISKSPITVTGNVTSQYKIKSLIGRRCKVDSVIKCSGYVNIPITNNNFTFVDKEAISTGQWRYEGILTDEKGSQAKTSTSFYYGRVSVGIQ